MPLVMYKLQANTSKIIISLTRTTRTFNFTLRTIAISTKIAARHRSVQNTKTK